MDGAMRNLDLIENWVFDLDNTLYPASCSLFPQIDIRMRDFIADALGLTPVKAHALQKAYYHKHGTTLRGLMLNHNIEPDAFLAYVHDIDCSVLAPAPRLVAAIANLPGRKVVFTNGSERHALNVLEQLNLTAHFEAVFDIRASGFIPKPAPETYQTLVRRHALDPLRTVMFEDLARNLVPAAKIGMTTVWVRDPHHSHWTDDDTSDGAHIHHVTEDLATWLEQTVTDRVDPATATAQAGSNRDVR
jgi:putative hydrolase of the HAD superfamily